MDRYLVEDIQVYSNEVPRVMHDPASGDLTFTLGYIGKYLKTFFSKTAAPN